MGPITLFDKSFLQSLSLDESVWFDHLFYPVISPLFYIETLADLEKAVRQGRTPEQEVGIIADKSPELHGGICAHHSQLIIGNLMGYSIPMNGRIPMASGRHVKSEGKRGVIFDPSPETKAFKRWQERKFLEVEREFAQAWRTSLSNLDLLAVAAAMRGMGINPQQCKSLQEAKTLADKMVNSVDKPHDLIKLAFVFLDIPGHLQPRILAKWSQNGCPPITTYAPYATYVLGIELFFEIALAANLIGTQRSSNRIDVAYLFYLPFSMIFVSSDNLHRRCAPLFLRPDQSFVWGQDLKVHLQKINEHFLKLPTSELEKGIYHFGSKPPGNDGCLVSELWDRHLASWRNLDKEKVSSDNEDDRQKLLEEMKRSCKADTLPLEKVDFDADNADFMTISRVVRKRKGSWWQLPKDLKESNQEPSL